MSMPVIVPGTITRCQAITDIVTSVASEQTALSHILNAESEKIERIVEDANTPQQLLDVNKSAQSVVDAIFILELILRSKLGIFECCLCEECPPIA